MPHGSPAEPADQRRALVGQRLPTALVREVDAHAESEREGGQADAEQEPVDRSQPQPVDPVAEPRGRRIARPELTKTALDARRVCRCSNADIKLCACTGSNHVRPRTPCNHASIHRQAAREIGKPRRHLDLVRKFANSGP